MLVAEKRKRLTVNGPRPLELTVLRCLMLLCVLGWPLDLESSAALFTEQVDFPEKGELSLCLWMETTLAGEEAGIVLLLALGLGLTDWLEVGVSEALLGYVWRGEYSLDLPKPYARVRLREFDEAGWPGWALASGMALPWGRGPAAAEGAAFWVVSPLSFSFFVERLLLHLSLGLTAALGNEKLVRPHWGVAVDVAIPSSEIKLVGEVFAGDPYQPLGPPLGIQGGFYWHLHESISLDLSVVAFLEPGSDWQADWFARLGFSWSIDL